MPYELLIEPEVHEARKHLPGYVRQQVKRALDGLADEPRPLRSRDLDVTGLDVPLRVELRRWRMDQWRILYAVNDDEGWVWALAVRRRPPYDYDDLNELVARLK